MDLFTKKIYNPIPNAFGLDISDFSLKIAKLERRGEGLKLVSFGEKKIPRGIIEKGRIRKQDQLAELIEQVIKEVKGEPLKERYAICSLPEEEAFVRVVQLPPAMKKEEIAEGIKWEIEANIPHPVEKVYFDWQVIPPPKRPKFSNVLVAALSREVIDGYVAVLKKAHFQPEILEIESFSVVRSLVQGFRASHPLMILDIGVSGTGLTIFSGQTIVFTSHFDFSGGKMVKAIIKKLGVEEKEADRLKKVIGLDQSKREGKVYQALVPLVNEFSEGIKKYIEYYYEHGQVEYVPDGVIIRILLCGGDSNLIGLPSYLSLKLGVPVQLGNPWVNILKPPLKEIPELPYKKSLAYTTALGLALRGV